LDVNFVLHRSQKPIEENTVVFKVPLWMHKPEIRQYLEKVYQITPAKVNTLRRQGKVKTEDKGKLIRKKSIKS
jgi:ribosomal protein L23